jgi:hypothetical protein
MGEPDFELKRAMRTAQRSIEAAQAHVLTEDVILHLTAAVQQLAFVVNRLIDGSNKQNDQK